MLEQLTWCMAGVVAVLAIAIWVWRLRMRSTKTKGRRGEKRVRKALRRLPRRNYIVLNELMVPTSGERFTQIDHVVVSTRGVFIIETKALLGHIQGGEESQYWQQRFLMNSHSFYNPLLQNATHVRTLQRLLRGVPNELFVSVVVFTEAWRIDVLTEDLVKQRRWWRSRHIKRTLDPERSVKARWWRGERGVTLDESKMVMRLPALVGELKRRPKLITREDMEEIASRIEKANVSQRGMRRNHAKQVQRTAREKEREIRSGRCPRCGGELRLREGRTGPFFGCSNYPECRFTCPAEKL